MNVVIIRFSSLGDCILLCPLAERLHAAGARVTVVTKRAFVELFSAATGVDRLVALGSGGGVTALRGIARSLRDDTDVVIDAHNNWRSRALSAMLGGASVRFQKNYGARLGLIVFKRRVELPTMLEQYGGLAEAVGSHAGLLPGGIAVPAQIERRIGERLGSDSREHIALAPGSRWAMKRWPVVRYLELAKRIAEERGARIVLVGDRADGELCTAFAGELGDALIDATDNGGILETAAYIQRCAGFVGNDSSLMHLAEALGVPVAGIFGPTVEEFGYYPALESSRVIERKLDCRPCSRNGALPCPRGTQECMTGIDVDTVENAVTGMLAGSGSRRIVVEASVAAGKPGNRNE